MRAYKGVWKQLVQNAVLQKSLLFDLMWPDQPASDPSAAHPTVGQPFSPPSVGGGSGHEVGYTAYEKGMLLRLMERYGLLVELRPEAASAGSLASGSNATGGGGGGGGGGGDTASTSHEANRDPTFLVPSLLPAETAEHAKIRIFPSGSVGAGAWDEDGHGGGGGVVGADSGGGGGGGGSRNTGLSCLLAFELVQHGSGVPVAQPLLNGGGG
jgi:hypothetical protein